MGPFEPASWIVVLPELCPVGIDVGAVGFEKAGPGVGVAEPGSMGLSMIPAAPGASRRGMSSTVGWKARRARMSKLPPVGREV